MALGRRLLYYTTRSLTIRRQCVGKAAEDLISKIQREVAAGRYTLPLKAIDDATGGQDLSVDMKATTGFQITY